MNKLGILAGTIIILSSPFTSFAATYDNFNGSSIDEERWNIFGPGVSESGGQLKLSGSQTGIVRGLNSDTWLRGDFQISVKYNWQATENSSPATLTDIGLEIQDAYDPRNYWFNVTRAWNTLGTGENEYRSNAWEQGNLPTTSVNTTDTSGYFKITRDSHTVKSYYSSNGTQWQKLNEAEDLFQDYKDPIGMSLWARPEENVTNFTGSFDDVDIKLNSPLYPVVLVHGLNSNDLDTWRDNGVTGFFDSLGWDPGGKVFVSLTDDLVNNIDQNDITVEFTNQSGQGPNGDYFVVDFEQNEEGIVKQGKGLNEAIKSIKNQTGAAKVVLLTHSMGGLAAREYIRGDYYGDDVAELITIGTPHEGTPWAKPNVVKDKLAEIGFSLLDLDKLDPYSDSLRDMRNDSVYLWGDLEQKVAAQSPTYDTDVNYNNNRSGTDQITGLNTKPYPNGPQYVSLYSERDGFISVESQRMDVEGKSIEVNKRLWHLLEPRDHGAIMHALGYDWPLTIWAGSPVDLAIMDPSGFVLGKDGGDLFGAYYFESDIDGDGTSDPQITVVNPLFGDYFIKVFPRAGTSPEDIFTLGMFANGHESILADHSRIQDIPEAPYSFYYQQENNQVVPEPSTVSLFSLGLLAFMRMARTKKRLMIRKEMPI